MRVELPGGIGSLKKVIGKENKAATTEKKQLEFGKNNSLSFMSIPSLAFTGKLVVPVLPEKLKSLSQPVIKIQDNKKLLDSDKEPAISYKVYPQDPLVTKPAVYQIKGAVVPGPESNRIKTVDDDNPKARPDKKGNYIEDIEKPQFDRVNSFAFAQKTLKMYENALGREIPWAFNTDQIKVHPRAGVTMNAYYSRWEEVIKLFYFQNKFKPQETCYTSKMADVITHETGHAVLDGLRPSYIGWGSHGGAIHEGFGDSTAMLVSLDDKSIIDNVIEKTGGDLRKENLVASLGEQFGMAVYGNKLYLRNAINNLKMSDFLNGKESKEVHNFGRLFGAMFYDIICEMAAKHSKTMPLKDALIKTKEDLTKIFARAMGDFAPPGNVYYDDVAKALLKAEKTDFKGEYRDILKKIFLKREVLDNDMITSWEKSEAKLPQLMLPPKTIEAKETIVDFISKHKEELGLPATASYELESAYNNSFGETFIQLKSPQQILIPAGDEFGGNNYSINLYEGLTLGFDKTGKLFYKGENTTHNFEIDDAIKDAQEVLNKQSQIQNTGGLQPVVYRESSSSNVLVKVPKIEDPVNV